MTGRKHGFPYGERAAAARATHRNLREKFKAVTRRKDAEAPATRAWIAAIDEHRAAVAGALPTHFWDDIKRLGNRDPVGLETAIEFLEADPWFFRSGYIKQDVIRYVKAFSLSPRQEERLRLVVLNAVKMRDRREFRSYCRLARRVDSPELRADLESLARSEGSIARRAGWVLDVLAQR